ncbi:hypothetical protein MHU86_21708 [Fragilaria crotonensis]|nr:hypothetical protein MHU86_21708 [Fragilaria crotonensis]
MDTIHVALEHVLHEEAVDEHPVRVWKAIVDLTTQLLYRQQRPYRTMKKRAKRAYLFQIQTHEGPNPMTLSLLAELGIIVTNNDAETVHQDLVLPCFNQNPLMVPQDLMDSLNADRLLQSVAATNKNVATSSSSTEAEEEGDDRNDDDNDATPSTK